MYFIMLSLLLTACVSRSPAQVTTVPNPFRVDAPAATPDATTVAPAPAEVTPVEPPLVDASRPPKRTPENDPTMVALPPATNGSKTMLITSWNVRHLGRNSFDLRNNDLLDTADVITFQEVNTKETGREALRIIKVGIEQRTNTKMCYAYSPIPSGGTEVYGFIWRNDRVAYVTRAGEVKLDCDKNAILIPLADKNKDLIVREPALLTAVFRPAGKLFGLASVHLVPTGNGKKPELEVEPLFDTFSDAKIPLIVAGDFNLPPTKTRGRGDPFSVARGLGFNAALIGVKTSIKSAERAYSKAYDNFWSRGFSSRDVKVVDILEIFKDVDLKTLRDDISDHAPISAGFEFQ